jgi:hypothetical protein
MYIMRFDNDGKPQAILSSDEAAGTDRVSEWVGIVADMKIIETEVVKNMLPAIRGMPAHKDRGDAWCVALAECTARALLHWGVPFLDALGVGEGYLRAWLMGQITKYKIIERQMG